MRTHLAICLALVTGLALSACENPTGQQVGAGIAGGTIGAVGARLLGANEAWTVVGAAAGATAGALYARNRQNNQCAYHTGRTLPNGQAEVEVRPCR